MSTVTVMIGLTGQTYFSGLLDSLLSSPLVAKVILISPDELRHLPPKCESFVGGTPTAGTTLNRLLPMVDTPYLLIMQQCRDLNLGPGCLERFLEVAAITKAGMVYSDYYENESLELREHPVNDYQPGSIRHEFDFGILTLFSVEAVRHSLNKWGPIADTGRAGFYDLRLKISLDYPLYHIREALYAVRPLESEADLFAYVDPENYSFQKELEVLATKHLQRLGAFLEPVFRDLPSHRHSFPVTASVIIPVRNREHTIAEAVQSALAQETDFNFNVLVVDNHSSDGTTAVLEKLAGRHETLHHIIPARRDLKIGGCWNEAIFSASCGRYAVQLDSDDLYSSSRTLQEIIELFRSGNFAMVIGSYMLVNSQLEQIPPGLIDHREWTESNGRNNALRINGLGAPRAFDAEVLRNCGFLNVSYGEDYAVALRISRLYRIGRIYENLYLCRRWGGNSDAALTIVQRNRYDAFKDQVRTLEIMARQEMNRQKTGVLVGNQ